MTGRMVACFSLQCGPGSGVHGRGEQHGHRGGRGAAAVRHIPRRHHHRPHQHAHRHDEPLVRGHTGKAAQLVKQLFFNQISVSYLLSQLESCHKCD